MFKMKGMVLILLLKNGTILNPLTNVISNHAGECLLFTHSAIFENFASWNIKK